METILVMFVQPRVPSPLVIGLGVYGDWNQTRHGFWSGVDVKVGGPGKEARLGLARLVGWTDSPWDGFAKCSVVSTAFMMKPG